MSGSIDRTSMPTSMTPGVPPLSGCSNGWPTRWNCGSSPDSKSVMRIHLTARLMTLVLPWLLGGRCRYKAAASTSVGNGHVAQQGWRWGRRRLADRRNLSRVKETVTYVEMTARGQLESAAPVPGMDLRPLDRDSPLVVDLQVRIGAPYGWTSARRAEAEWASWFASCPGRTFWLLTFEDEPAGLLSYDVHPDDEVEIETFGLVPEFVGMGLGGHALTLGVQRAWELTPTVKRVWLHTSTLDHPHALSNYHRRGFRTFKIEEGERG
ncbi:GNAT family N-acetyltransferase [Nocardia miyunensis]|uniref:GNAT family N-acetyltransferase n=1 Tax=Nocardia miyunensis TaxID=282684 RepID=UPI001C3FF401|nr:GNAT family N-acetyltransferase [Nocardia miyunensis]